jgi:hypothetical protein
VLCCAVLCCAVLCCAVLCCAVLCCAVLCCAVLYCAVLCGVSIFLSTNSSKESIIVSFSPSNLSTNRPHTLHYTTLQALQLYVEKVVVFTQANPVEDLGPECSAVLAEYAGLLASQGRLDVAATYLKGITLYGFHHTS